MFSFLIFCRLTNCNTFIVIKNTTKEMPKAKIIKEIPFISVKQMIEVDRLTREDYGISMM